MKPLLILLSTFLIAVFCTKWFNHHYDLAFSARLAMSVMLLFTAMGHFAFTKGMTMMLPGFVPFKKGMVYFTGVVEIFAAVGLIIPGFRILTAWLLILFFILLLPANIYAARKRIDIQKGTLEGHGLNYLWFRIPLQILFIMWTYFSAIRF